MKKYIAVIAGLTVVIWAFGANLDISATKGPLSPSLSLLLPSFSIPSLKVPNLGNAPAGAAAWNVWEEYLEAARDHDLARVKALSHKISPTCADPALEAECFTLMDSVYFFASGLTAAEFRHVEADARQIIMYTDGPEVKLFYFTRDQNGSPLVLGLRFCDDTNAPEGGTCADLNVDTGDDDTDGWWNSIESFF